MVEPLLHFFIGGPDVPLAQGLEVVGRCALRRIEETLERRDRIGAPEQLDLSHVVSRHHTRVVRVELIRHVIVGKPGVNRVHTVCDDEARAVHKLCDEVPEGPIHGPSEPDLDAIDSDEREGAVDGLYGFCRTGADELTSLIDRQVEDDVLVRVSEVDDAVQWDISSVHNSSVSVCVPGCICYPPSTSTSRASVRSSRS